MRLAISGLEWLAARLLATACALRGFRGLPDDQHHLAHLATAQLALDSEGCNGVCACDRIIDALARHRKTVN